MLKSETTKLDPQVIEAIDRYRSILYTMTKELVTKWRRKFRRSAIRDENVARFLEQSDNFAWEYFESVIDAMPASVSTDLRQVQRDLRRVVNNLQRNWGELLTACNQRENDYLHGQLKVADGEAKCLYERYRGFKAKADGEDVLPITYFGARYDITRYPFTPFPLLSFRFEALAEPRLRRNGLAHELGHFIYWNAASVAESEKLIEAHHSLDDVIEKEVDSSSRANKHTEKLPAEWQNWKPEVFADIVGALLIGASYVQTSMQLYLDEQPFDEAAIYAEDSTHPLAILRPLIGLVALEKLGDERILTASQRAQLEKLRDRWNKRYEQAMRRWTENGQEAPESIERREKAAAAVQQTTPVVHALMTQPLWLNKHGEKCPLITLFDYNHECDDTAAPPKPKKRRRIKSESFAVMTSALVDAAKKKTQPIQTTLGETSQNPSYEEALLKYRALVELQVAETEGYFPCVRVVRAAANNGIYKRVSDCADGSMNVIRLAGNTGEFNPAA